MFYQLSDDLVMGSESIGGLMGIMRRDGGEVSWKALISQASGGNTIGFDINLEGS
jgi:hypothetical protein